MVVILVLEEVHPVDGIVDDGFDFLDESIAGPVNHDYNYIKAVCNALRSFCSFSNELFIK